MSGRESFDSEPSEDQAAESVSSSSDSENEGFDENWHDPTGNQPKLTTFSGPCGPIMENLDISSENTAAACFELLVPNILFEEIAKQTNLYASEQSEDESKAYGKWTVTNKNEIKRFFGLIIWMGLVRLPSVSLYWSHDPAYVQTFPEKVMPRNRFEILLQMIYFTDNRTKNPDCLYKIQSLVQTLEENFKKYYIPTKDIHIDETSVPFYGRITLKEHLRQKRYKHGVRIFKLCCASGYTYAIRVFNGKLLRKECMSPTKIAKSLCQDLFDKGYTLYTDDWYTSLKLAYKLIANNTHLVGALRRRRRGNPETVVSKALRRGEMFAQENGDGITVFKWKDRRKMLLLSTKHTSEMVRYQSRSETILIPEVVVDFNKGMPTIDISDRVDAYYNPIMSSVKWYRKVAFELLFNVTVTNSFILYKAITKDDICITEFRKNLALYLTQCQDEVPPRTCTKRRCRI